MTGCGALSAVSGILDSNHGRQRRNGPRCPPQVPPPSGPSGEVATPGGTLTAPHVCLAGTVLVGVSAHRSTRPAAGHHGDASAPAQPLQMAVVRHGFGRPTAMRQVCRTPAVRSAAGGPVGAHRHNGQRT
jgi:hypothetical protein